jgi:hypothetical protein
MNLARCTTRDSLSADDLIAPVTLSEAEDFVSRYVEEVSAPKQTSGAEQIVVTLDDSAQVEAASSTKPSNWRFKLGDMLLETFGSATAVAGSSGKLLPMLIVTLRFLRRAQQLAQIEIEPQDAEVLLAVFRLQTECKTVTVDQIVEKMAGQQSPTGIAGSLHRLETLSCLTVDMDRVSFNEDILVQSKH